MLNKIMRTLGIIVGIAFIVVAPLMWLMEDKSVFSLISQVLMGALFVYFGVTNRSIPDELFKKMSGIKGL